MSDDNLKRAIRDALDGEYEQAVPQMEEHIFSHKFEKKMERLVKRRKKPYYRMINTVGKRVACLAVIALLLSLVVSLPSAALHKLFKNFSVFTFKEGSDIQSDMLGREGEDVPYSIEDLYEITCDLSGFTITEENTWELSHTVYYEKEEQYIFFEQSTKPDYNALWNTEDAELTRTHVNGYEAIYWEMNDGSHTVIWDNGEYIIDINTNLGKNALFEMAKSVKKVEK